MKRKKGTLLLLFVLLWQSASFSQQCPPGGAAFINEFSGSGIDEYIELVVIGDPASPLAPVNLEGWLVDDNNIAMTGQGTASGHLKLGSCFNSMLPGSIIVVYNTDFPAAGINPGFPNVDGAYVISHADPCITICTSNPNTTDDSYIPCANEGYESWSDCLGLATTGDGAQIRKPDASFYHGLFYNTIFGPDGEAGCLNVGNIESSLTCGDWFDVNNYESLTRTPGLPNNEINQALIDAITAGELDCGNFEAACSLFECPVITDIQMPDEMCANYDFNVLATGLANMGITQNTEADFGINFVLFPGATEPPDPYSGGTLIETVPNGNLSGVDPDQSAEITTSITTSGTYQICAILNPEASPPDCAPYVCQTIEIYNTPTAELSGTHSFCPGDCYKINAVISGGTQPFELSFEISVGFFSIPFTIPAFDVVNQFLICYEEGGLLPSFDFGSNILTIPTIFTGTASFVITGMVDDNGCSPLTISPNNLTIILNDSPEISAIGPLVVCDEDADGLEWFDLVSVEHLLNGGTGLDVSWYEDENGFIPIVDPGNFYSGSNTVYASIYDDFCPSDTIPVELVVIDPPDPGNDAEVDICNVDNTILDFEFLTGGEPGGDWEDTDGSGVDISYPDAVDFEGVPAGTYTFNYTVYGTDPCPDVFSTITVHVFEPPFAGIDHETGLCLGSSILFNFPELIGIPSDLTGNWEDLDGSNVDLTDLTQINFSAVPVGAYRFRFTVSGPIVCNDASTILTITIYEEPNPGTDQTIPICNAGNSSTDLEAALGSHDGGGYWIDEDLSGVDLSVPSNVDFTGILVGTYTFIYIIPASESCEEVSATITVQVSEFLSAGEDLDMDLCEGFTPFINLFELLQGESNESGNWSQVFGSAVDISDPYNILLSEVPTGILVFQYTLTGNCGSDFSTININITEGPNAGKDYFLLTCSGIDTINLFDSLNNYDPSGFWYDQNYNLVPVPDTLFFNSSGTFEFSFIVSSGNGCQPDTALAMIQVIDELSAGADSSVFVCQGQNWVQDLFELIPGVMDSSGYWTQLSGLSVDLTNPRAVPFNGLTAEIDTFLYVLESKCGIDSAFAIINVDDAPYAGDDYSLSLCSDQGTFSLYDNLVNFSPGGAWFDENYVAVISPSSYILSLPGTYAFYYILPQNGTCLSDTAFASITVNAAPNAGLDASISICEPLGITVNLFELLNGNPDADGTWTEVSQFGIDLADWASLDISGWIPGNEYSFLYVSQNGTQSLCPADSAYVTISIPSIPNPGTDNYFAFCQTKNAKIINLDSLLLVHDNNGVWMDNMGSGVDLSVPGKVDFNSLEAGIYTYTYQVERPGCEPLNATITIEIMESPDAGSDDLLITCEGSQEIINLLNLLEPGIDINGDWTQQGVPVIDLSEPQMIDISSLPDGNYTIYYILSGNAICTPDTAIFTISIQNLPKTGICDTTVVCNSPSEIPLDMQSLLTGYDPGGSFRELTNSGVNLGNIHSVEFVNVLEGRYIFEYFFPESGNCPEVATRIYIDVAGYDEIDFSASVCPDESFVIGNNTYDLLHPAGMELLQNLSGCDSIIHVNLIPKVIELQLDVSDANCFGVGSIEIIQDEGVEFPLNLENPGLGIFEITSLPFYIENVPPGDYHLDFTDDLSCSTSQNISIAEFKGFTLELEDEVHIKSGENYQITVWTDIIPAWISWWPDFGLDCSDCLEPLASPVEDTDYILTIVDEEGCTVTDTIRIRIDIETNIYIPNAFSPNKDAYNPYFNVQSNRTGTYSMKIYDRWGELIFAEKSLPVNQENTGWDGTYNGKELDPGVYVYLIEIQLPDGTVQVLAGDITLVR